MRLLVVIGCLFTCIEAAQYSLINCSWPCVNPENGCIVTIEGASCWNRVSNSWMINTPLKAPFYTGAFVSISGQACQPAPIPNLPAASLGDNVTNPGQSVIMWPISSLRRPLDEYLGNCGHGLYCSSTGEDKLNPVCRHRFSIASTCVSSNQCLSGFCLNGSCELSTNNTTADDRHSRHWKNNTANDNNTTVQILASVFGIVGTLTVSAVGFVVYRRHRKNKQQKENDGGEKEESHIAYVPNHEHSQSTSSVASSSNAPLSTNNNLHKQFASDFLHEEETAVTPAMQQSQLQHDMLRSHGEDNTYLQPPPSYKP